MPHVVLSVADQVVIQAGSVVSKIVHRDEVLNVTVFGCDAGEGLSEHQATRAAVVQVVSGRLRSRLTARISISCPDPGSICRRVHPMLSRPSSRP